MNYQIQKVCCFVTSSAIAVATSVGSTCSLAISQTLIHKVKILFVAKQQIEVNI